MNSIIEYFTGMNTLTDQVIATDLLLSAKTGVLQYAMAITEAASEEVKEALKKQLEYEIQVHEELTDYMMSKGWYHPYNVSEQLALDHTLSETTISLPSVL